jgi:radical SAM/Cys-rich protein
MHADQQIDALDRFPQPFASRHENGLHAVSLHTFQINVGKRCNQACRHCHVDASPVRTEMMDAATAELCLQVLAELPAVKVVDITGGAPEMNPHFKRLVAGSRKLGKRVIDRCNLTILCEPGFEWLAPFLAENQVEVVASMPHWGAELTDRQRGNGVFQRSIQGLLQLNALGYGSSLPLDLVHNPGGLFLAGDQAALEREFKVRFSELGIQFHHLLCLNNMPVSRFLDALLKRGQFDLYLDTLAAAYNPGTVEGLMCRHQISVGYDGSLFDCDFNQMLDLKTEPISHLSEFDVRLLTSRRIRTANHCYGCTAGSGSSCGGSIST